MADKRRTSRLGGQMLRDISTMMDAELAEKVHGMVTFTRVRLSNDLRYATIYYSVLGGEAERDEVAGYLEREKKRIRHEVGGLMRVRYIPEFTFKFDPSIEEGIRIEQLLNEIKSDTEKQ